MSRKGIELVDDLKVIASVDLVRGKDAVFAVDFEDGDRDHQVAGKLERVCLCKRKVVRHIEGSISGAGQFPIDGVLAQGRISSSAGHFVLRFRSEIWIIAVVFRPRNCRIHQWTKRRQEAARVPDFGPRCIIYSSMVIVGSRR